GEDDGDPALPIGPEPMPARADREGLQMASSDASWWAADWVTSTGRLPFPNLPQMSQTPAAPAEDLKAAVPEHR
ncbi:hypothetical protein KZZ05_21415, partial [Marinobacter adhaerens]|uniref:hypothetical protein n=1 Tax=Marinobacter adhaerens TaxID=1033846 RepID=UPI001C605729